MSANVPRLTTLFGGRLNVADTAQKPIGLLWLLTGASFIAAGVLGLTGAPLWFGFATVASAVSLVMCVVAWPLSKVGVAVNAALLLLLPLGQLGWIAALRFMQT